MELEFRGYLRANGDVGTRNQVAVIASVICSSRPVQEIADAVPGAVAITHQYGCSQVGDDLSQTRRTLAGVVANPNIAAALIVGLGCETNQARALAEHVPVPKPIEVMGIQEVGGSDVTFRLGAEIVERFIKEREGEERVTQGAGSLTVGVLGVEADERTYQAVYPAVGHVIDRLVQAGARVILGVSGAMAAGAYALALRAMDDETRQRLEILAQGLVRKHWLETFHGAAVERPYTDDERDRARRELALSGTAPVEGVVTYAERPARSGIVVMTVPQNPVEAMAGLVAGGANIILVASSRGLFSGALAVPTLVVAPAHKRQSALDEFIDCRVESDDASQEADRILEVLLEVASGKECAAEREQLGQFAISQLWTSF